MLGYLTEIVNAIIMSSLFIYIWREGAANNLGRQKGWGLAFTGFGFLTFGSLIGILRFAPFLGDLRVVNNVEFVAALQNIFGYTIGSFFLAFGFLEWLPTLTTLRESDRALKKSYDQMEKKVRERTADLKKLNDNLWSEIAERKKAQDALHKSEEQLRTLINAMPDMVIFKDVRGRWMEANDFTIRLYQLENVEYKDRTDMELADVNEFYRESFLDSAGVDSDNSVARFEKTVPQPSGDDRVFDVIKVPVYHGDGGKKGGVVIGRDITERKRSEEKLRLAAAIVESTIEGIIITDARLVIQSVNAAFISITGYTSDEVIGKTPAVLKSGQHDKEFYKNMWGKISDSGHWEGEIWNRRKGGEAYPEWLTISAIKNEHGTITHYVGVFHDITSIKEHEERIKHTAYHDALTGLPNRLLFHDRLKLSIAKSHRHANKFSVMFIDLDNFKKVNDELGHEIGDLLLKGAAERLTMCVRQDDTVARLGGDEFTVILEEINTERDALMVGNKIIEKLREKFVLKGHECHVGASIGVASFPMSGADSETLIKNADAAMYRAKALGKNNCQIYSPTLLLDAGSGKKDKEGIVVLPKEKEKEEDKDEIVFYFTPTCKLPVSL